MILLLIQLLVFAFILMIIIGIGRSRPSVTLLEHEHLIGTETILYDIPKSSVKNTHWFTHTFMRPRRKG